MTEQITALHACWVLVTGQDLHFKATERIFFEMAKLDFKPDDLQCVLQHVLRYNKSHKHAPMKIQVHKLCSDLEVFASILAEAKAVARNITPNPTPREVILHEFRGVTPEQKGNCRPVAEIFETMRKAAS